MTKNTNFNGNMYFNGMYQLEPKDWELLAGVVVESVETSQGDYVAVPYVAYGTIGVEEAYESYTGRCQHCNHAIKHFVIMQNQKNHDVICIGWDCFNETFTMESRQALDIRRAKEAAERARANQERKAKVQSYKAKHAELVAYLESQPNNNFLVACWMA